MPAHSNLQVEIDGAGEITFDGANSTRLFLVVSGGRLALNDLTLQNGNGSGGHGGAIDNLGTLEVSGSTFSGNVTSGLDGAIIRFGGALEVSGSTFDGNSATDSGGAIYTGAGALEVTASTFNGNSATDSGGALYHGGGVMTVTGATFSGNSAASGGVIHTTAPIVAVFRSSILANSPDGGNCNIAVESGSYNLSDDGACAFSAIGDQANASPNLAALADNGGPTQTMLPQHPSDALDAIPAADCAAYTSSHDQRGVLRPKGAGCDIGAVELIVPVIDDVTISPGDPVTVTVSASDPDGLVPGPLSYAFDCDGDGDFEVGPQPGNETTCAPDPTTLSPQIGVRVTNAEGGMADEIVTLALSQIYCANRYTGVLSLRPRGCTGSEREVVLTSDAPTTFCASRYTNELRYLPNGCLGSSWLTYVVPGPSPVPTCVNRFTSAMRIALRGGCGANEVLHFIPAA